ncbi:MAPEG family protein (plasmid) [Legionella sp. D16C41]|uniref:MAPEG family protein n=1 Tax=Legionella sp. D16C41 TaxID=3402688 RepID=UPI003AF728E2
MITPLYSALLTLMLIGLSIHVIKGRRKISIGLGDFDNVEMKRRVRAQANFIEYTPLFLILLGYAEYNKLPHWSIHIIAIFFVIGRIMHAYSLLSSEQYKDGKLVSNPFWRICGMICTFTTMSLLSIILLIQNLL